MAVWDGWKIIDGWRVGHTSDGHTLSAQFFSKSRDNAPARAAAVPRSGINAVPAAFASYKVSDVEITPVSAAGPFVLMVTAKAGLGSSGLGNTGDTLLKSNDLTASYTDFHIRPSWCGLKPAPADARPATVEGWHTGKWASAITGDGPNSWTQWRSAFINNTGIQGSPFTRMVKPSLADDTLRFLQVTVSFHAKETTAGLANWGDFSGVVPINSMPAWITIPGGDNRWRLFEEEISRETETDGRTQLFKITRVLLGIPNIAQDCAKRRLQWDQTKIGQRDWDKL